MQTIKENIQITIIRNINTYKCPGNVKPTNCK
jgi:hypothetical protein